MCYIHAVGLLFSHEKVCSIDNHDCMDRPQSITQTNKIRAPKNMNCTTQFVGIYQDEMQGGDHVVNTGKVEQWKVDIGWISVQHELCGYFSCRQDEMPNQNSFGRERFLLAPSLRGQFIMAEESWRQGCEADGHIASMVRMQRDECQCVASSHSPLGSGSPIQSELFDVGETNTEAPSQRCLEAGVLVHSRFCVIESVSTTTGREIQN